MTEVKDIVFEEDWYSGTWNETVLYFTAPVSYLNGDYPEADGCTFLLRYSGKEWNAEDACVRISPFKDDSETHRDYDWHPCFCDPEFKQALYDIYENRGKENS